MVILLSIAYGRCILLVSYCCVVFALRLTPLRVFRTMTDAKDGVSPVLNIPSPIIHKRNRTESQSVRAAEGTDEHGVIDAFCREKGHGFVKTDAGELLFVHVYE